jgi:Ni/Fe-hydrogenase subunit HybB-like protein
VVLWIIALLRLQDFVHRHVFTTIFKGSYEAYFLWTELTLCFVIPLTMLSFKKVRTNPHLLYLAALSTILGFVTNRLNVAVTSMDRWNGSHYLPSFTETSITLMICALGFFFFNMAVRFLPIFEDEHHEDSHTTLASEQLGAGQPTLVH